MRKRRQYEEGDWFGVPLRGGGFGVGLAARVGRSGVGFGYFFGPKRDALPTVDELGALTPADAVLAKRFYDDALKKGEWPRIGPCKAWSRDAWPMPAFLTGSPMPGTKAWRVVFSDDDPIDKAEVVEISSEQEKEGLGPTQISGEGVVEEQLTRLLDPAAAGAGEEDAAARRDADGAEASFYLYFASKDVASAAAHELEDESFDVRVEGPLEEPPDLPFLLLATRRFAVASADDDVEAAEELMERVAAAHGGDYDGLEREVV
jgi:hypothetical protein